MIGAPDVTILMPMKDTRAYVLEAIESVLAQSDVAVEVIVIDDGSRDGSPDIVRAIGDRRVRVIVNDGVGIAAAINTGLDAARGDLVARCDSDDRYEPGRLARQVAWLRDHETFDAVCGGFASLTPAGRLVADLRCGERAEEITDEMVHGGLRTSLATFLVRTGLLRHVGGCREYFVTAEDIDLQLRLAEHGRVWFDPRRCYLYRLHDASITHTKSSDLRDFYQETALFFQRQRREEGHDDLERGCPPDPPEDVAAPSGCRRQIQGNLLGAARREHAAGRRRHAIRCGLRACLAHPTNVKAWRSLGAMTLRGREK